MTTEEVLKDKIVTGKVCLRISSFLWNFRQLTGLPYR